MEPKDESLPWIEPTQTMLATSTDPQKATNAVSYNSEDGTTFINMPPPDNTLISSNIIIPIDKMLAPGVLFIPQTMEHKWAIYYHNKKKTRSLSNPCSRPLTPGTRVHP